MIPQATSAALRRRRRTTTGRRALCAPLLSLLLVVGAVVADVPAATSAAATPRRAATSPAALPAVGQLLRGLGLADLLSGLLPVPARPPSLAPAVVDRVVASTVRVSGRACGVTVAGSGFSPAPDTIVTNAHVVAGVDQPQVLRPDGRRLPARVQVFDPDRDLAVLAVPGLGEQPLALGPATVGSNDAVFGHPLGQVPVEVSSARVLRQVKVPVGDIYDQGSFVRQILVLAADLQPGDSGAPVVDQAGSVVGIAFAVSNFRPSTAFAVASGELGPVLAQRRGDAVSTGPCLVS